MSDDRPDDPADEPSGDEPAGRPERPRAVPVASPAARVATVAMAIVVLLVVGVVLALQAAEDGPGPAPGATGTPTGPTTAVPPPPPSDATPSGEESLLPPELTGVPSSLCPELTIQHPITVLSFNIHGGLGHGRRLQLDRVAKEIASWKADVVLLQEVDDHRRRSGLARQAAVLGKLTDMSWIYGGNHQRPDGGPIGNAILSRYEVKDWQNVLLPRAGGREQRGLLHAVVDVEGTEVSVYSTHLDHASSGARLAQARAIARHLAKDPLPTILAGDLNARPGSDPLRTLRAAGLGDAWAAGEGAGMTAPARRPRHRIDYVLHDERFAPLQAAVLFSAVSDHRAVWARVELREEVGCIEVGG